MTNFIHIGLGKTGTTSIQAALLEHRDQLKDQGTLYPRAGLVEFCQHGLYEEDKGVGVPGSREALKREIAHWTGNIVISSEYFSYAPEPLARSLKEILGEAKIIFYCRPQIALIESVFLQWAKAGDDYCGSIANFYRSHQRGFDFMSVIANWVRVFGDTNIVAHVYHPSVVGDNSAAHFFSLIGHRDLKPEREELNTSLRPEVMPVIRVLDAAKVEPKLREEVVSALLDVSKQLGKERRSLISDELALEIAERYTRSNVEFATRFLPPEERGMLRPEFWPEVRAAQNAGTARGTRV